MRDHLGPAVLRLWCAAGHSIGSLIDVVTGDALATYVPLGMPSQSWPPKHRVTGRPAVWMSFSCSACSAEFEDSVDAIYAAMRSVRSNPHRSTSDFFFPRADGQQRPAERARHASAPSGFDR